MATYPIKIKTTREGDQCITEVCGDKGRVLSRRSVKADTVDAERLATIITLERILDKADGPVAGKVLPPPVLAMLKLVHRLVSLKYKAMTSGSPDATIEAQKAIEEAKNSPVKAVRALAAAISAYLK